MKYLLDTNIIVYLVKRQPARVLQSFQQYAVDELTVSAISVAELQVGVERSSNPSQNQSALDLILTPLHILPFDDSAARTYGHLRTTLERQGLPIGPFDTLIAAHAISRGLTLVTNDLREFARVPGLRAINWV